MKIKEERQVDSKGVLVLPTYFEKNKNVIKSNFRYKQIDRNKKIAIYEVTKENSNRKWWEVVKIQTHNGYVLAGITFQPSESYPKPEAWGESGWTFLDRKQAFNKFDSLVN